MKNLLFLFLLLPLFLFSQDNSLEKVKLQLQWKYQFQFAGFIVAKEMGYYKEVGLDVDILEYDNSDINEKLEKEIVDYAINNSILVHTDSKLKDVTLLATYFQRSPLVIITQPEIKSVLDLKGKKVMMSANNRKNSSLSILLRYFQLSKENLSFLNPSFNIEDFVEKKVDAITAFRSNEVFELTQRNIPFNIIDPVEYGFSTNAINLFTSQKKLTSNPEQVKGFLAASKRGWEYALENIEEVAKLIHQKYQPNKSLENLIFEGKVTKDLMLQEIYEIGEINKEFIYKTYEQLVKSGQLEANQDSSKLFFETIKIKQINLTSEEKKWIENNRNVLFTGDPNWLPYEAFNENGDYIGIVADYLEYIEEVTGLAFKPTPVSSWSEALSVATSGDVQVITSDSADMTLSKQFSPVDVYSHNPIVIVMNKEQNYVEDVQQIADKKIAIIKDYGYTVDIYRHYPEMEFFEVENIQEGLAGVAEGRFDAMLATMALTSYSISKMQLHNLKVVGKTPIVMELTLFISKDIPLLHSIINKAIHSMPEEKKQNILNKWMKQEYVEKIDMSVVYQVVGILLFLLTIALLWNHRMRLEIAKRQEIQDSLELSEKNLKDIFDNAQSGLMYISGKRILIKANQRLADIFGYDNPDEMLGFDMRRLHLSEENYIEYGKKNFETLRNGVKRYIEYELCRKDGTSIWCELSGKAIDEHIPADLSKGVLWTINDISLRKIYETSLQKSEIRYKSLFYSNRAIELIIDAENQEIFDCNQSAEKFYGYTRESLLNLKISDINIMTQKEIQKEINLAKEQKREVFHFRHRLSSGQIKDVEVYSAPIELEGKSYLYSIIFDISHKRELEKNQKLLQERFSYAVEGSNDGLWDWNIQTNEVYFSPRWKDILGYTDDELENSFSIWETLVHPDDLKLSWTELERFLSSKELEDRFHANFRMKHKDGHYVPILSRARKVLDDENQVERLVGTHVDMTELYTVQNAYKQERDRSKLYLDTAEVLLVALDEEARVTMLNRKGEELLGFTEKEILGKVWFELGVLPSEIVNDVKAFFSSLLDIDEIPNEEFQHHLITKSGEKLMFSFHSSFLVDEKGKRIGLLSSGMDITEKVRAEEELDKQHKFLQTVMNSVGDSIMVIEKDYTISMMNDEAKKHLNTRWVSDPTKPKCYEVSHHRDTPCDGISHPCPLEKTIESKKPTKVVHIHKDVNDKETYFELTTVPLFDENNEVQAIIESAHDVTELREAHNTLQHQAEHDSLTNLPNRTLFLDRLNQAIKYAKRTKSKVAVLFLDLDHFKEINDSLGHSVGDKLLKLVANRLLSTLRESDTVARQGGDEFAIIIDHIDYMEIISTIVQNIMQEFRKPFTLEGQNLYMTMSIGVAIYPDDGIESEVLLKNSDAAMYKAKHSGRDNYQYYTEDMTEHAFERIVLETQLRESLEKEEMEVYYQLQVDASDDKIVGMEALIRWNHPNIGLVSPDKFIPLAEDTGFILQLDEWVMIQALAQFKKWYSQGYNPGVLSINLSPIRLEQANFASQLQNTILKMDVDSSWINLEVTEGQIMRNPDQAIKTLAEIHDLGIRLAIDDFGTGYSSLSYLKRLPIDKLKIDQSFIHDIPENKDDVEITKTIISMAKGLNLDVIAEGVETQEQKEFLLENGCHEIQGYLYHKPSPAIEVEKMLKKC